MQVLRRLLLCATALVATLGLASGAFAYSWSLNSEFSGGTQPENTYTVTITDDGAGTVTLTMAITGSSANEFADAWYFNYTGTVANLTFVLASHTLAGSPPVVAKGTDAYKADGDGLYDVRITFDTSPPAHRFRTGDTVVYTITSSASGLDASDFNTLSTPDGGHGPFYTALHVQAIGAEGGSGWVTIPEPGSVAVFSLGLLVAGAMVRRFGRPGEDA